MKFYKGERVVTIREGIDYKKGWTGTVEKSNPATHKLILDNGTGGELGWYILSKDLELIEPREPYEVDE